MLHKSLNQNRDFATYNSPNTCTNSNFRESQSCLFIEHIDRKTFLRIVDSFSAYVFVDCNLHCTADYFNVLSVIPPVLILGLSDHLVSFFFV